MTDAVTAEAVILDLVGVLLGTDEVDSRGRRVDRGLMSLVLNGRQHTPGCPRGQYRSDGDSLRGGSPCSDRCLGATAAISHAVAWLKAQPRQMALVEVAG